MTIKELQIPVSLLHELSVAFQLFSESCAEAATGIVDDDEEFCLDFLARLQVISDLLEGGIDGS